MVVVALLYMKYPFPLFIWKFLLSPLAPTIYVVYMLVAALNVETLLMWGFSVPNVLAVELYVGVHPIMFHPGYNVSVRGASTLVPVSVRVVGRVQLIK